MELLQQIFGPGDFMPHGYCYLWNPALVWLNVVSDSLIALSYFTIPFALLWFVRKRRDLPFSFIFVLFGTFIVACGATHVMEVWNLWREGTWREGWRGYWENNEEERKRCEQFFLDYEIRLDAL